MINVVLLNLNSGSPNSKPHFAFNSWTNEIITTAAPQVFLFLLEEEKNHFLLPYKLTVYHNEKIFFSNARNIITI